MSWVESKLRHSPSPLHDKSKAIAASDGDNSLSSDDDEDIENNSGSSSEDEPFEGDLIQRSNKLSEREDLTRSTDEPNKKGADERTITAFVRKSALDGTKMLVDSALLKVTIVFSLPTHTFFSLRNKPTFPLTYLTCYLLSVDP